MSGIEVAGIVLAILPIAVGAAKACSEGIGESKKLLTTKGHEEIKRDLFDDLYRELVLFSRHTRKVLQSLPEISQQRSVEVLSSLEIKEWQSHSDVVQALKRQLGTDFDDFEHAIGQVFHWLNGVLIDKHLYPQVVAKDPAIFLKNLKVFAETSGTKTTESRFKERLYLWHNEGQLKKKVKRLRKWREFLERITENAQSRHSLSNPGDKQTATARPSCAIPKLSKELYQVLSTSLRCVPGCSGGHGTRLCLQNEKDLHRKAEGDSLRYKLLLSTSTHAPGSGDEEWLETAITVKTRPRKGTVSFNPPDPRLEQVQSICSTVSMHSRKQGAKLCFDVYHFEDNLSTELYRARNYLRSYFNFQPTAKEIRLNDVLADLGRYLDLTQRRQLALELSYGMMTLSGSPWLDDRWSKEHISFFQTQTDGICHTQPLVSSDMRCHTNPRNPLPLDVMHPLPPVLSLGILLLELETGKSIESMRIDDDYVDPSTRIVDDNTDFTAAIREAEKQSMLSPQYKQAVLACLNEQDWDDGQGAEPNVLREETRKKIYEQIIHKLESDLDALTSPAP